MFSASRPALYVKATREDTRLRALFAEKGNPVDITVISSPEQEIALSEVNVDNVYPVLVDRHLILYGSALDEYVHERWPGPQLLPTDPTHRAYARMLEGYIRRWYSLPEPEVTKYLTGVEKLYDAKNTYFLGRLITVVDIALLPLVCNDAYDPETVAFADYIDRLCNAAAMRQAA